MSLSIPNAPNAGLFKQGYQKYVSLPPQDVIHIIGQSLTFSQATMQKMELSFATSMPAEQSHRQSRRRWGRMVATRSSSTTSRK